MIQIDAEVLMLDIVAIVQDPKLRLDFGLVGHGIPVMIYLKEIYYVW
jgi:hypothetical protein